MRHILVLLVFFSLLWNTVRAQQLYTGANQCQVRIETDKKEYSFITRAMSARLDDVLERFEFTIPLNSLQSLGDSSDLAFIRSLAANRDLVIHAPLPDDKDGELDLSYFKGNRLLPLAGELQVGNFKFEDDFDFNGILMGDTQRMAFNFIMMIDTRHSTFVNTGKQQVMEIELGVKGDKIIGLTSNE